MTESYAAMNPARTTPVLEVEGRYLTESNAILWYLAEHSSLLPLASFDRAMVVRWLLFEQGWVSGIAGLRFRLQTGFLAPEDPSVASRRASGHRTLCLLEERLGVRDFLVDSGYSIADIANYAYVHVAPDVDLSLSEFPAIERWIERIEETPGFVNDLAPLPPDGSERHGLSIYT